MLAAYSRVLERCEPYLVIPDHFRDRVSTRPLGVEVRNLLNPQDVGSARFLHLLERVDDMIFGPIGMEMPRWVFYDCAEMPGGMFGFAKPARALPAWLREVIQVPD